MRNVVDVLNGLDKRSSRLLEIVQRYGPLSKNELESITQLKKSTLNRGLEMLFDNLLIVEASTGESTGGRKPLLLDVNKGQYYLIGVDISRIYIQIVITNLKMEILSERFHHGIIPIERKGELILNCINQMLDKLSINISEVIGVGLGVVIPIHRSNERVGTEFISKLLREKLRVRVYIDNGANTAALAEYNFGVERKNQSLAFIHCGVGIRSALISNGNIIRTINNSEDAFAHMIVDIGGELCLCGNYGCIESYCSISKITERFIDEIEREQKMKLGKPIEEIDYIDICRLAEERDELAEKIIEDASVYFGAGLANFIKIVAPENVILSGPLIKHSPLFYELSIEMALKKCPPQNKGNIKFHRDGFFKDKSIAIGAAYLTLAGILHDNLTK